MADKKEILKKLRNMFTQEGRLENKFAKHDKFNKKYNDLFDEAKQIKADAARKASRGDMTQDQIDDVSADLKKIRDKMKKIEERDLKLAGRAEKQIERMRDKTIKKIDRKTSRGAYKYDDLDKA